MSGAAIGTVIIAGPFAFSSTRRQRRKQEAEDRRYWRSIHKKHGVKMTATARDIRKLLKGNS